METLRGEAQALGGQIMSNLGNHEFMNAIGEWILTFVVTYC